MKAMTFALAALLLSGTAYASDDLAGSYKCKIKVDASEGMNASAADAIAITRSGKNISFTNPGDGSVQTLECKTGKANVIIQGAKAKGLVSCSKSELVTALKMNIQGTNIQMSMSLTKKDARKLVVEMDVQTETSGEIATASARGVCLQK